MGVSYRRLDPTGVIAEVKGTKSNSDKIVALRADMDALSIQEKTDYEFKSINDGIMHACGHDTHTSMLLSAVKIANSIKDQFSGTIRFIFQPGEEVAKGAKAVCAQGGMDGRRRHLRASTPLSRPLSANCWPATAPAMPPPTAILWSSKAKPATAQLPRPAWTPLFAVLLWL